MGKRGTSVRIVLASGFLADYPQGGGHWSWFLQYLRGLRALGHDVVVLELLRSTGDSQTDAYFIRSFFHFTTACGFRDKTALLFERSGTPFSLENAHVYGMTVDQVRRLCNDADVLWNFCGTATEPLLRLFRRRVLIDTDPGIYQLSARYWEMGIDEHEVLLTVGTNVGCTDCEVPSLNRIWRTFRPFVHLPAWPVVSDPGVTTPFTSVTHWRWDDEVFDWNGKVISTSKREAYLGYLDVPRRAHRRFELAAHIHPDDDTGDRELLRSHGWELGYPEKIAHTPEHYQAYIQQSRAEFACVKPIYRGLKTGWFSDRSVCYLATGRPVVCEETRLSSEIPTGQGILTFTNEEEAICAIEEVDRAYATHARAARELAEGLFDARSCLSKMLDCCG